MPLALTERLAANSSSETLKIRFVPVQVLLPRVGVLEILEYLARLGFLALLAIIHIANRSTSFLHAAITTSL